MNEQYFHSMSFHSIILPILYWVPNFNLLYHYRVSCINDINYKVYTKITYSHHILILRLSFFIIIFFYKCFDQMWFNEETRIAQVANINQLPGTDGFTSPPKDVMINRADR